MKTFTSLNLYFNINPNLKSKSKFAGVVFYIIGSHLLSSRTSVGLRIRAFYYFLKSIVNGYQPALTAIAFCLEFGIGGASCDCRSAEIVYLKSGQLLHDAFSYARLTFLKTYGRTGVMMDYAQAQIYKKLSEKYTTESSILWILHLAQGGLAEAEFCVSLLYSNGLLIPKNESQGFSYCIRAALFGLASAQNVLGNIYSCGSGVEQDYQIAMHWYHRAADQGDAGALYNLGTMYEHGFGIEADINMAYQYYTYSADFGHSHAQNALGICFEQGLGVKSSPSDAVKWYTLSALSGHRHAQYNLASCYLRGYGITQNEKTAIEWFRKAALQQDQLSSITLSFCLELGIGCKNKMRKKRLPEAMSHYLSVIDYSSNAGKEQDDHDSGIHQLACIANRRLKIIVACQILVPSRLLLSRPGGYLKRKKNSKQKVGIWSAPVEVIEHILSFLNYGNILETKIVRNIFNLVNGISYEFMIPGMTMDTCIPSLKTNSPSLSGPSSPMITSPTSTTSPTVSMLVSPPMSPETKATLIKYPRKSEFFQLIGIWCPNFKCSECIPSSGRRCVRIDHVMGSYSVDLNDY